MTFNVFAGFAVAFVALIPIVTLLKLPPFKLKLQLFVAKTPVAIEKNELPLKGLNDISAVVGAVIFTPVPVPLPEKVFAFNIPECAPL